MSVTVLVPAARQPVVVPGPAQVAAASAAAALARAYMELAQLAALTIDNAHPDTAAGLAATAEGETFWVYDPADKLLKIYRKTAGLAVFLNSVATSTAVLAARAYGSIASQGIDTWLNGGAIGADIGPLFVGHNTPSADAVTLDAAGNWPPGIATRRSLGTLSVPTPVTSGTQLGYWDFRGYNSDGLGGGFDYNAASFDAIVDPGTAFAAGDTPPTKFRWGTSDGGDVRPVMELTPSGRLELGAEGGSISVSALGSPLLWVTQEAADYAAIIASRVASGGVGLRLHTLGTGATDFPLAVSSGAGAGSFVAAIDARGFMRLGGGFQPLYQLDVRSTANDWASRVKSDPAAGLSFGLLVEIKGTGATDYALAAKANGADIFTITGSGNVALTGSLIVAGVTVIGNPAPITDATTARTAALTDAGRYIRFTNAGATAFTIPPNATVAFPIGSEIHGVQAGAGAVTLVAGAGVTLNAYGADLTLAGQWGGFTAKKVATNEWDVHGKFA